MQKTEIVKIPVLNSFDDYIEIIWTKVRSLLMLTQGWSELPEKFSIGDCKTSEYWSLPFDSIHRYHKYYDIIFKKQFLVLDIKITNHEDLFLTHETKFNSNIESECISFGKFDEFIFDTENPNLSEWMQLISSLQIS